jgi:hypothetical protein
MRKGSEIVSLRPSKRKKGIFRIRFKRNLKFHIRTETIKYEKIKQGFERKMPLAALRQKLGAS